MMTDKLEVAQASFKSLDINYPALLGQTSYPEVFD